MNPKPLNVRLRQSLDDSYRLVYLIDNERLHLIVYSLINIVFPCMFLLIGVFIYAELTGASQMSKSFDHPYLITAGGTFYIALIYFITRKTQSFNIMRIYYSETKDNFVSFRQLNVTSKYKMDTFTSKDVVCRFDPMLKKKSGTIVELLTKNLGNVLIKGELRQINFKQFSSNTVLEKMIGKKNMGYLKN